MCPPAYTIEHDLERQLDRVGIGDCQEPHDVAGVPNAAFLEVEHAIGVEVERLLDPVLDDHDGVALIGQPAQRAQEPGRGQRVEVRERFVDHVQDRPEHEDAGHREELALAAGQRRCLAAEEVLDPRRSGHL